MDPSTELPMKQYWGTVYQGPEKKDIKFESGLELPKIIKPTDILIKVLKTTVCGTDLHIVNGNVKTVSQGRRLGHEGIGEIIEIGDKVQFRKVGQRVLVSCITSCGDCPSCRNNFQGHCEDGGWILGHLIDGMQTNFARIPHGDHSTYIIPNHLWNTDMESGLVMCSDILPTGLEVGLLDGSIKQGMSIAIVGVSPVGLAALICCRFYSPTQVFVIDKNEYRLQVCKEFGSLSGFENTQIHLVNNKDDTAVDQVLKLTRNVGVDLIVEAIGLPVGWYISQDIVKPGGHIAMLGVHGKPVTFHIQNMWYRYFKLTAGMVHGYTTQKIMEDIFSGNLNPTCLISHTLPLSQIEKAYHMFRNSDKFKSLKILLVNDI